ncbi:hypothetical protein NDU88_005190 [Pleurodeles waltl]|uniref:Uncharacterized protein n=1 Tax=Pleurodeles waltl TaxID=8319 RepID=A0AAV7M8K6_PLEWA|nr:hypothetical protein NDU88_005190 [Pleurodeles waltl]
MSTCHCLLPGRPSLKNALCVESWVSHLLGHCLPAYCPPLPRVKEATAGCRATPEADGDELGCAWGTSRALESDLQEDRNRAAWWVRVRQIPICSQHGGLIQPQGSYLHRCSRAAMEVAAADPDWF